MKLRILLLVLGPALPALAQTPALTAPETKPAAKVERPYELPDGRPFAATITTTELRDLVNNLAAPEMAGRETGEEGQRKAADYIARQFQLAGLPKMGDANSYFQRIQLQKDAWTAISLNVGEKEYKNRQDFYVFPTFNPDLPKIDLSKVVFVGYGIDDPKYSNYKNADVEGKAVIFYDGEPIDKENNSLITGKQFRSEWSLDWRKKVQVAKAKGAVMAFIIDTKFADNLKANRKLISTYGWRPVSDNAGEQEKLYTNSMFITPEVAAAIMGDKAAKVDDVHADLLSGEKFKPVTIKSKISVELDKETDKLLGSNVIGFVEGTDPELKKEFVFVTAHYDHLGQVDNLIYHGADDNASGTAGVIEIARAFAEAKATGKGAKRSMVFMLVSGEEKGLLGSRFYVEYPLFPLKKTVADINIDMIGRVDDLHDGNPDYIYVIGADRISSELKVLVENANLEHTNLALDYKYDAPDDPNHYYERSDHYNFAERGIPSVFFFNGTHADYHRPTDTADKINVEALQKRAQLAFYTAWDIANRPWKPTIDKPVTKQ